MIRPPPRSTLFPYTPLFRSGRMQNSRSRRNLAFTDIVERSRICRPPGGRLLFLCLFQRLMNTAHSFPSDPTDRKSTRLNSSHSQISYAVFCLKKKRLAIGRPPQIELSVPLLACGRQPDRSLHPSATPIKHCRLVLFIGPSESCLRNTTR